jgi:hypothetical protein
MTLKAEKDRKVFIQVQATQEEREMLSDLAYNRRISMSQAVREWVREAHKRMVKGQAK